MHQFKNSITSLDNGILTITISRPHALNALSSDTLDELSTAVDHVYSDKNIKGVIITGDGDKAFVAGADIKEFSGLTRESAFAMAKKGQDIFSRIEHAGKPVIAAVNGFALGGGCELAMACHIRIATENARFGQPEVNLGIIPGYGGTQRLTKLVGRGKALELMLTGDLITAQEAKDIGLINHLVANKSELQALSLKIMTTILSKAPLAIAHVIKSVNAGFPSEEKGYEAEAANFSACTVTKDFEEGARAFVEKRKPTFKGE